MGKKNPSPLHVTLKFTVAGITIEELMVYKMQPYDYLRINLMSILEGTRFIQMVAAKLQTLIATGEP